MNSLSNMRPQQMTFALLRGATLFSLAAVATGASLTWNNSSGGSASNAVNWNPSQSPGSADDLTFNLNATFGVTYNASSASSASHSYRRGNVTATFSTPHTSSGEVRLGTLFGDNATLNITDGTLISNTAVTVSAAVGATGTLNVTGRNSLLHAAGVNSDIRVGNSLQGTMTISTGGHAIADDDVIIGNGLNGNGVLNVQGSSVLPFPVTVSRLDIGNTLALAPNGTAALNISGGALVTVADDIIMSPTATSNSSITIGGASILGPASLFGDGDLEIADNGAGAIAGQAIVTVNAAGLVDIAGTTFLGDPDGSTSTLRIDGGTFITSAVELNANSVLDFRGGILDVVGGTFDYNNPISHFKLGGTNAPTLTLRNGALAALTVVTAGRGLTVGGGLAGVTEIADFDVRSGSQLFITAGDAVIGESANDEGGIIVNGTNSRMTMATGYHLVVGQSGIGRLEAELSGRIEGANLFIARNPGSEGTVLIENPGTIAQFNEFQLGGSRTAPGGAGTFTINDNAICNIVNSAIDCNVWPNSILSVLDGGLFTLPNRIRVQPGGRVQLNNAEIDGTEMVVQGNGSIDGSGDLNLHLILQDPSSKLSLTGDLDINSPPTADGLNNIAGIVEIGDHHLRIFSQNLPILNNATLGATGILESNAPLTVAAGRTLSGDGTVFAEILNLGSIVGTGTGLAFQRMVRGSGEGISGQPIQFLGSGGFEGDGTIDTQVSSTLFTQILATGDLTMGSFQTVIGAQIGGFLSVGANDVKLRSAQFTRIANTDIRGGRVQALGPNGNVELAIINDGIVRGTGTLNSSLFRHSNGTIAPEGVDANNPVGQILIGSGAPYVSSPGGTARMEMDLGASTDSSSTDRITFSGSATLTDVTAVINVEPGAVLPPGTMRLILVHAGPRIGEFKAIVPGPLNPDGLRFEAVYGSNTTQIRVVGLVGDLNCDGVVSVSDIGPFVLALTNPAGYDVQFPNCGISTGDINGDGIVSVSDIGAFVALLTGV